MGDVSCGNCGRNVTETYVCGNEHPPLENSGDQQMCCECMGCPGAPT